MLTKHMFENKKKINLKYYCYTYIYLKIFKLSQNFKSLQNSKILITYRDPLVSICSTCKNWSKYGGVHMTLTLIHELSFHFNIFNNLRDYKNKIRVIKLKKL